MVQPSIPARDLRDDGPEDGDVPFLQALLQYLKREDAGQPVDRRKVLDEFPHCSDLLRHAFETADLVADAAAELSLIDASADTVVADRAAIAEPATGAHASGRAASGVDSQSAHLGESTLRTRIVAPLGHAADSGGPTASGGAAAPEQDTMPSRRLGRYRIEKRLGGGGMGDVFLAVDERFNRKVALKVPKLEVSDEMSVEILLRFQREAMTAGGLQHPYICPVYDYGEDDGRYYIAMAYIDGQPLSDMIRAQPGISPRRAVDIVRKLAMALQAAHDNGIVHRDLKPGNVMIGRHGEPQLTDFGLAALIDCGDASRLSNDGTPIGTPAYMAPEQARGELARIGPATDVYGLGAILYQLLSGRPPFSGSQWVIVTQVLHEAPAPFAARPDLPVPDLEALCLRMLAKKSEDRPATMRQVIEELEPIMQRLDSVSGSATAGSGSATAGSAVLDGLPRAESRVDSKAATVHLERADVGMERPGASIGVADASDARRDRAAPSRLGDTFENGRAAVATAAVDTAAARAPSLPRGRLWIAALAAAAALTALAAVAIVVSTNRGTLTIESDAPDVKIRITRDGRDAPAPEITVGKSSTTYRCGDYAIELEGTAKDTHEITPKAFQVRRGETVVVKISHKNQTPVVVPPPAPGPDPVHPPHPLPVGVDLTRRKIATTQATVARLRDLILPKWDALHAFRLPRETPGLTPKARAEQRTSAILWAMRMELPSRYEDLLAKPTANILPDRGLTNDFYEPLRNYPSQKAYLAFCRGKGHVYAGDAAEFRCLENNESAECLYLAVAVGLKVDVADKFRPEEIGDTDGDGMPEFLDAWGRPIEFILWPFGFRSKLQKSPAEAEESPLFREAAEAGMYYAPGYNPNFFRYRFWPLIVSAGPDGQLGLYHDPSRFPNGSPNDGRGVYAPLASGVALDGLVTLPADAADNIHSHDLPAAAPAK